MQVVTESQRPNGIVIVTISAVLFRICMLVLKYLCPIPSTVLKKNKTQRWLNISVSLTHSAVSSVGSLFCFYIDPSLPTKIVDSHEVSAYIVTCISLGYFIHDFIDAIQNQSVSKAWEILLHHVVVIFCFGIAVFKQQFVNYAIVSLLCEINSVFLHIRQLLNLSGVPSTTTMYRLNSLINICTYILFRICTLSWMVRWLVFHQHAVPFFFHTVGVIGMCIMIIINLVLFARLLNKDFWNRVTHSNLDSLKTK